MSDTLSDDYQSKPLLEVITLSLDPGTNPELGLDSEVVEALIKNTGSFVEVVYSKGCK